MKRIICFAAVFLLLLAAVPLADAENPRVVDSAQLLTSFQQQKLEEIAGSLASEYSIDAVIVTVGALGGKTPQVFADNYFDYNGYGTGSQGSGVLLLIAMEDRDWYISTHAEGTDALTYREIGELEDLIVPDLSGGNYYSAFVTYLNFLETEFADFRSGAPGITVTDVLLRLAAALGIGAVIALIVLLIMRSKMNTAKQQSGAGYYMVGGSYELYRCQDFFLYSRTTKSARAQSSSGSTHRSSSGRSHSGRGGKF